jgi:uncharacterized protein (TIGR03000 family)
MTWDLPRARSAVALASLLAVLGVGPGRVGAGKDEQKPATITILLPEKLREYYDTELRVDGKLVRITGKGSKREWTSEPLDTAKAQLHKFEVLLQPNNYTKITRTRSLRIKGGDAVSLDATKDDPKQPDRVVIRWVPTPKDIVLKMCELAKIGKGDVVYDLGCGDGVTIITAVKDARAKRGVGIDIDPKRVKEARQAAKDAGVADRIEIRKGDILDLKKSDIDDADVVMLYLANEMNIRLRPMLWKNLKPGTRIVSHRFTMGDWRPQRSITVKGEDGDEYELHLWTITGKEGKKE